MKNYDVKVTQSEEYKTYVAALARLSSQYVAEIRRQYAAKAYELYAVEPVRRLVLAYWAEVQKLDADRIRAFTWAALDDAPEAASLEDFCLNKAGAYATAISFYFLGE